MVGIFGAVMTIQLGTTLRNERTVVVAPQRRGCAVAREVRSMAATPELRTAAFQGERRLVAVTD